ncbi:hypothetical protein M9H77_08838 [Catharanthus roseus]|uniref:Uncharacterized protein n=1 Tax=Catharanthus roseus TaxID=4058 RepID=A0ACC0BYV8_CATRO|nr:hypothetical protein M9H77_08838 [Catharanthus roseus]
MPSGAGWPAQSLLVSFPGDLAVCLLNESSSKTGRLVLLFLVRFLRSNISIPLFYTETGHSIFRVGSPVLETDVRFLSWSGFIYVTGLITSVFFNITLSTIYK